MRDNYLFQRICRECDKWEQEVKGKMVCEIKPVIQVKGELV